MPLAKLLILTSFLTERECAGILGFARAGFDSRLAYANAPAKSAAIESAHFSFSGALTSIVDWEFPRHAGDYYLILRLFCRRCRHACFSFHAARGAE